MDYKLEMVQFPVSDVDRAKAFYLDQLGCSLVVDREVPEGKRVVQVLPPGSACAIGLCDSITDAPSGTAQALLVVTDTQAARDELTSRGVEVRDMRFRDDDGQWSKASTRSTPATSHSPSSTIPTATSGSCRSAASQRPRSTET
jgi:catechol 2,3-dioxygenase-like lactoylglutathione lyase family enzyme